MFTRLNPIRAKSNHRVTNSTLFVAVLKIESAQIQKIDENYVINANVSTWNINQQHICLVKSFDMKKKSKHC